MRRGMSGIADDLWALAVGNTHGCQVYDWYCSTSGRPKNGGNPVANCGEAKARVTSSNIEVVCLITNKGGDLALSYAGMGRNEEQKDKGGKGGHGWGASGSTNLL
jgi:hypothetical protein